MKRVIAFVCVIVLAAAALTACGQQPIVNGNQQAPVSVVDNANSVVDNGNTVSSAEASSVDAASQADIQIPSSDIKGTGTAPDGIKVEVLPAISEYSNKLFFIMTNNSGADCNIKEIEVNFFDADGKIIDISDGGYVDAFQNGTTVVESMYSDDPFASYEYTVETEELDYYIPVDKDLSVEVSMASNKAIISVTNNGTKIAKYPEYTAFFYKDGKLVYDNWGYVDDSDSEIKPGATERDTASCYEEFDDVKVFVHSYAYEDD